MGNLWAFANVIDKSIKLSQDNSIRDMQPERIPSMVTIGGARNVQYQFDRRAILGQGSFATVYRCGDYAVKEISMANFGINRPTFDTLLGR